MRYISRYSSKVFLAVCCLLVSQATCGSAIAQTYEDLARPLRIASPTDQSVILKKYYPEGPYIYQLFLDQISRENKITAGPGHSCCGQNEGVEVAWDGDQKLTIGAPDRGVLPIGPRRLRDIDIDYVTYDPIAMSVHVASESSTQLTNVIFTATGGDTGFHGIDCTIEIAGDDEAGGVHLRVRITGHGSGMERHDPSPGTGTVSLSFRVDASPQNSLHLLTLTQAEFGTVDASFDYGRHFNNVEQNDGWITYAWFPSDKAKQIFEALRSGRFDITTVYDFSKTKMVFHVGTAIDDKAAASYRACEGHTNIFTRLIGMSLSKSNESN